MAFLDNSGDIILDAVLTDAGRKRLAQGDGTFRIVKFALSDDEIDYSLFNKSHPSGSAYYDLEIMQTPILEAFTNNTSSLKHKLISMSQTNLLFLPVIKLNSNGSKNTGSQFKAINETTLKDSGVFTPIANGVHDGSGVFVIPADDATAARFLETDDLSHNLSSRSGIRVVQGIDSDEMSFRREMASNQFETQYIIQADYRMLMLKTTGGQMKAESYIDDDMIASYYLSRNIDGEMVKNIDYDRGTDDASNLLSEQEKIIKGPMGTVCEFNFSTSQEIQTSTSLFDELGGQTMNLTDGEDYTYIDTNVRVSGATTGSSIDIPIRIMKHKP